MTTSDIFLLLFAKRASLVFIVPPAMSSLYMRGARVVKRLAEKNAALF